MKLNEILNDDNMPMLARILKRLDGLIKLKKLFIVIGDEPCRVTGVDPDVLVTRITTLVPGDKKHAERIHCVVVRYQIDDNVGSQGTKRIPWSVADERWAVRRHLDGFMIEERPNEGE